MQYEEFIDNYSIELQLIDALDHIKDLSPDAAEILDRWASHSKAEKNASLNSPMDPSSGSCPPDTQSL
jgi:hypothetical protein